MSHGLTLPNHSLSVSASRTYICRLCHATSQQRGGCTQSCGNASTGRETAGDLYVNGGEEDGGGDTVAESTVKIG